MNIKLVQEPLPTQAYIKECEGYWEITLPKDYYCFLKKYNGGEPVENILCMQNNEYVVERFLSLFEFPQNHAFGEHDINVVWFQVDGRLFTDEDNTGIELLPIAELFAGDMLCLNFKTQSNCPSVVIWHAHESEYLKPVFEKVCNSFSDLTKLLRTSEALNN